MGRVLQLKIILASQNMKVIYVDGSINVPLAHYRAQHIRLPLRRQVEQHVTILVNSQHCTAQPSFRIRMLIIFSTMI
jgi:hypothetical protein